MSDLERCNTCDRPKATPEQFEHGVCGKATGNVDGCECDGCCGVCWGSTDWGCRINQVDWRARALAAEARLVEKGL